MIEQPGGFPNIVGIIKGLGKNEDADKLAQKRIDDPDSFMDEASDSSAKPIQAPKYFSDNPLAPLKGDSDEADIKDQAYRKEQDDKQKKSFSGRVDRARQGANSANESYKRKKEGLGKNVDKALPAEQFNAERLANGLSKIINLNLAEMGNRPDTLVTGFGEGVPSIDGLALTKRGKDQAEAFLAEVSNKYQDKVTRNEMLSGINQLRRDIVASTKNLSQEEFDKLSPTAQTAYINEAKSKLALRKIANSIQMRMLSKESNFKGVDAKTNREIAQERRSPFARLKSKVREIFVNVKEGSENLASDLQEDGKEQLKKANDRRKDFLNGMKGKWARLGTVVGLTVLLTLGLGARDNHVDASEGIGRAESSVNFEEKSEDTDQDLGVRDLGIPSGDQAENTNFELRENEPSNQESIDVHDTAESLYGGELSPESHRVLSSFLAGNDNPSEDDVSRGLQLITLAGIDTLRPGEVISDLPDSALAIQVYNIVDYSGNYFDDHVDASGSHISKAKALENLRQEHLENNPVELTIPEGMESLEDFRS